MIIKRRTKPLPLQKLEAALSRLSQHHPRLHDINYEFHKLRKGYTGEQQVDYHLEQLPSNYTILHDVYLRPPHRKSFQIDSLICTNNALFIIESKNFNDKIIFNTIQNQFTRISDGVEKGYRNPITQAESTRLKLIEWLSDHHIYSIPVYYLIAISEPSTIINVVGNDEAIAKVVSHAEYTPQKIMQLDEALKKRSANKWNGLQIGKTILGECEEYDYDVFARVGIKISDILPGVICPKCQKVGMERVFGAWKCAQCNHKSKYAHRSALSDYFCLGNETITNTECMRFLLTRSPTQTSRLLKSSNLQYDSYHRRWSPHKAKQRLNTNLSIK